LSGLVAVDRADVPYLTFPTLSDAPGLIHGVFTRAGGVSAPPYASLNVSYMVGDDRAGVQENRARIARALGGAPERLFSTRQVHGADSCAIDAATTARAIEREPFDILLSGTPGQLLLLKFADCVPLLVWDARRRWVAVAHAGWRGTALNAAAATVGALAAAGSVPGDLSAGIGPAIGGCCYEVGADVAGAVAAVVPDPARVQLQPRPGSTHLDLAEANRQQLIAAGVPAERVAVAGRCTACEVNTFFSHRALGAPAGRFAVVAGVC